MKKRIIFLSLLTIICSLDLSFLSTNKEANAYTVSSLPTTIDLNDCTDNEVKSYYSSLSSLSESEKSGQNLLKNLKTILSNNQKYYSYDSGSTIWKIYEISDRDWDKSPASEISGYNSTTNKITGYSYKNESETIYVHSLYTNRDVDNLATAYGNHQQSEWGINREHIWPKSLGFDNEGEGGARGDVMHLWSGNGKINNMHSNYPYGYVDKSKTYTDGNSYYSYVSNNYLGTSSSNGSGTVFEPQDCDKGDIARSIFYMVARYNNISGTDTNIDANNPNLTLTDDISNLKSGTSTATSAYSIGILHDLLKWHKLDPVDEFEIHRNNLLYRNYTNNRNPFIDYPEWADYIWGEPLDNMTYSATTGYVDLTSDVINGYKNSSQTDESDNTTTDTLNNANTINYSSSTYKEWTYTSSTSEITYKGKSAGSNTTIQLNATSPSGIVITNSNKSITKINVTWNSNTSSTSTRKVTIYGSTSPYTSTSDLYDESKCGTILGTITYNASTELTISGDYKYIGIKANGALYLNEIKISYEDPKPEEVISTITLSGDMVYKSYEEGEEWNLTGIDVTIISNVSTNTYDLVTLIKDNKISLTLSPTKATLGTTSLTISNIIYDGYDLEINDMTITGITVIESSSTLLKIGKQYVISYDKEKSLLTSIENKIGVRTQVKEYYTDTYPLTIEEGYSSDTYSFKTKDNTYLAWTSGNSLITSDTKDKNSSWEVSLSNNLYKIKNVGTTEEERYLQYNSNENQERFAVYKNTQNDVNLTLIDDSFLVGSFIEKYMHPEIESTDLGTGLCISDNYYQTAKSNYLSLSDNVKNIFISDETYLPYYNRLSAWASANKDDLNSISSNSKLTNKTNNNDPLVATTIVIILISSIGASLYLIRKRKLSHN